MDSKQPKGSIFLSTLSAAFFFLWGGFLIINPAMAATITVCSSGCNATTIQDGIDMASSGDTVLVSAGTYDENLAMKSGVDVKSKGDNSTSTYMIVGGHTITAMNRAMNTVIHGDGETSVVRFPSTITTDVSLDGFIIENFTKSNTFLIRIDGGSPTIKNNIIHNNTGSGHSGGIGTESLVAEPADPLIENNLIHNVSGPGIGNGQNSNATIRNNVIWDCKDSKGPGIGLWGYAYPKIENNIIFESDQCAGIGSGFHHGTVKGLTAGGGNNTLTIPTIKGNIIHGNYKAGIHLERASGDTGTINVTIGTNSTSDGNNTIYGNDIGIRLNNLTSATIENNNIHDQTVRGIRLVGLTSATIHNNKINNQHMAGIRLESINNVTISNNDIHHSTSTSGIYFEVDVVQAIVENNQIHENKQAGIRNGHTFAGNIGADTLIVRNNNIYSNTKGGISIEHSGSTNTIQGNTIHDNVWGGIFIERASAVTVEDNQIYSNGYGGIYDEGSDFLSVNGTDIYDNHYGGIQINYGTGDGNITHNTIHQNYRGGIGIRNLNKF
jgi:parallel beta-helix repeat protein